MAPLNDPLFWALVSLFGLLGCCAVVGTRRLGGSPYPGAVLVGLFFIGRLLLPFQIQPRFSLGGVEVPLGWALVVLGAVAALGPTVAIRPLNAASKGMELKTGGLYGLVRNPIYLGELIWCAGLALARGSWVGVLLIPVWWAGLLFLILIEEESLERALGQDYLDYKARVRGRIIPGLPV